MKAKEELEHRGWKIEFEPGQGYVLMDPLGSLVMDRGQLHWKNLREAIDAANRIEDRCKHKTW